MFLLSLKKILNTLSQMKVEARFPTTIKFTILFTNLNQGKLLSIQHRDILISSERIINWLMLFSVMLLSIKQAVVNTSRFGLAHAYCDLMGLHCKLIPVSKETFKTKAQRPAFSCLSNRKLSKKLGCEIPSWKDGLRRYVTRLKEKGS